MAKGLAKSILRILAKNEDMASGVEDELFGASVAEAIYAARIEAGLTQRQLATLANTHQPVVARLESADYRGHSLTMLRRIARALGKQLRIEFWPPSPPQFAADADPEFTSLFDGLSSEKSIVTSYRSNQEWSAAQIVVAPKTLGSI